jgi:chitin synthase
LLIISFILSMGNRPQGSKWSYTFAMLFYAGLMGYMLFAAGWLTLKGVNAALEETNGKITGANLSTISAVFQNETFRNIVLSLASTYGLYFIASALFFEPWHMFTSFIQYMFLVPFYVNILNVYAFCNTHDVSWGTKGDNSSKNDLGTVTASGKGTIEIEVPTEQKDLNALYDEALTVLRQPHVEEHQKRDAATKQEDYYRAFRTRVVLAWILSNAALVVGITTTNANLDSIVPQQKRSNLYMAFVLWSVCGLAAFRFVGSCIYLIFRIFTGN